MRSDFMSQFIEAIQKVKAGPKRKFKQSVDMILNLKNIDMKKAENKIKTEFTLPHKLPKQKIIGFFAGNLIPQVKELEGVRMIRRDEIDSYKGNKKKMKALARECYSFLSEAPIMPSVGKVFGPVLAVRGKMPKPVPPATANVEPLVENARNTIQIALKASPVIQLQVGTEDMDDQKISENIEKVVSSIQATLPRGKEQTKNVMIKLTMGKPEIVELNVKGK